MSRGWRMWVNQRKEVTISNAIFAVTILLPLFASPFFRLPEFAPPQVIYSRDLVPLLLAPWASPSGFYRVLSRLLQSALLFRIQHDGVILPCYLFWIAIGLSRTLVGFLLSRSVGWTYPRLFNHWALYESSSGCGPALVAYLIGSGVRPDLSLLLTHLREYGWEVTESLSSLVVCALLAGLDYAPWTYGVAIGLAVLAIICRPLFAAAHSPETPYSHPDPDLHQRSPKIHPRAGIQTALLLLVFLVFSNATSAFLASSPILVAPPSKDGAPLLDILILSHPRPNDTPPSPEELSILSQTIASYLPYVSPSVALSVFTHVNPSTHPSFTDAQERFEDAPVTFFADEDTHNNAYQGQYLHLAEAFRWTVEKTANTAEWIMLIEDDFPLCGDWGWEGLLRVVRELEQGHNTPSPETTKMWGGFIGTGGSGLIIHHTLLPILAHTLRLHAFIDSPFPAFMTRRPPDIIIQDCLLGFDPLCPSALPSKDRAEGAWFVSRPQTMVITSRLVMDHIGGHASTALGRMYDSQKWRCGWRHPFHGRPEVLVVPVS